MLIDGKTIREASAEAYIRAACIAAPDGVEALRNALRKERSSSAKERLKLILRNIKLAAEIGKPMCQTFATPAAYVKIGTEAKIGCDLYREIGGGVRVATESGYLRPSIVEPISRTPIGGNTGRYVPNIEVEVMTGVNYIDITAHCTTELPPSCVRIFYPHEIEEEGVGIRKFVVETVLRAGGVPCPPMAIGVGIGGSMDVAARLSKRVSLTPWTALNENPTIASWERNLLQAVNQLNIGPFGLGGDTTATSVKVEMADAHAADLPVAVNLFCWACAVRKATARVHNNGSFELLDA